MAGKFTSENQPEGPSKGGRPRRAELYARPIRAAEDKVAGAFPEIVDQLLKIATGRATESLINHKTGAVETVPANPSTVLKAATYLVDRIAGKPEALKTHELGADAAKAVFSVVLGAAANAHWAGLQAPAPPREVLDISPYADKSPTSDELLLADHAGH